MTRAQLAQVAREIGQLTRLTRLTQDLTRLSQGAGMEDAITVANRKFREAFKGVITRRNAEAAGKVPSGGQQSRGGARTGPFPTFLEAVAAGRKVVDFSLGFYDVRWEQAGVFSEAVIKRLKPDLSGNVSYREFLEALPMIATRHSIPFKVEVSGGYCRILPVDPIMQMNVEYAYPLGMFATATVDVTEPLDYRDTLAARGYIDPLEYLLWIAGHTCTGPQMNGFPICASYGATVTYTLGNEALLTWKIT